MAKAATVLVVDDEPPIRRFLRTSLVATGYRVIEAENASGAMRLLPAEKPDLIIVDLGLPDKSGLELIGEIRETSTVPIVILSARHDEGSKVKALDLGADDYVSKPFGMDELMARLSAALRHAFQAHGELPVFVSGDLTVDLVRRHVTRGGREVRLSPKEFDLLRHLVMNAGKVLTHRYLLREVWGPAQEEEVQYLRVFIHLLRPDGGYRRIFLLVTHRGEGRFTQPTSAIRLGRGNWSSCPEAAIQPSAAGKPDQVHCSKRSIRRRSQ